ncbi:putative isotrichodermin c-15 hydroxylase protein [Eutypa lata UCREL1]|uniref:Putative isotrichodermin c-15 hydroxylase protein n=1 Tax=Eutypa lata (strain UCR-EL1) TaxID=1287681 RepID=M7SIQ4_EUTLA|nr:putative isotrichodermin c-15 hydroxylase protein [Eutypa lata UCREL1]
MVAGQLLSAGYEPISSQFLCTIVFLLHEPPSYKRLVEEIRGEFKSYDDINPDALAHLRFLHASLMETLRITITVQYGHFAFTRSPRYFHQPQSFRPERWLPPSHAHWDPAFKNDATSSFWPFSQGPRACPGMGTAWRQTRLFIAKVLWSFDVEVLPGQNIVFEDAFRQYAMWEKPKFWVRFHEVEREDGDAK